MKSNKIRKNRIRKLFALSICALILLVNLTVIGFAKNQDEVNLLNTTEASDITQTTITQATETEPAEQTQQTSEATSTDEQVEDTEEITTTIPSDAKLVSTAKNSSSKVKVAEIAAETISLSDYDMHQYGTPYCIFAQYVTFTREELSTINSKDQLENTIAERSDVTIAATNSHAFIQTLSHVSISQAVYEQIMNEKNTPPSDEDQPLNINLQISNSDFSGFQSDRNIGIKISITGPIYIEPTTETTTAPPPIVVPTTKKTVDRQTQRKNNRADESSKSWVQSCAKNNVETSGSSYDIINQTKKTDKSLEDEKLTADITAGIISPQPSNGGDKGGILDHVDTIALVTSALVTLGFALSIGSDISCIRRITQKRSINLKK